MLNGDRGYQGSIALEHMLKGREQRARSSLISNDNSSRKLAIIFLVAIDTWNGRNNLVYKIFR